MRFVKLSQKKGRKERNKERKKEKIGARLVGNVNNLEKEAVTQCWPGIMDTQVAYSQEQEKIT